MGDTTENVCDAIPCIIPVPFSAIPNPVFIVCNVMKGIVQGAARAIYFAVQVAHDILETSYEVETMSPGQEIDTAYRVEDLHANVDEFSKWNHQALETINSNVFKQHSEMRKHLQDRHQEMTSDIVETIQDSTNAIASFFTDQSEWLQDNFCIIYKEVTDKDDCVGNESLMSLIGVSLWNSIVGLESQGSETKDDLKGIKDEMQGTKNENEKMKANVKGLKDEMRGMKDEMRGMKDNMKELTDAMAGMTGMLTELVDQNKNM